MNDQEQAVQRLNEQLAQWRNVGQAEFAQMLGITEEELLAYISQGLPYHAHPSSPYGEYRFHASRVEEYRRRIECIQRGHEYEFDRYYDDRRLPVMKCQHCGHEDFRNEPYPADVPPTRWSGEAWASLPYPTTPMRRWSGEAWTSLPHTANMPAQSPADTSGPATPNQLNYLRDLNAWHTPDITKAAASDLIERAKLSRKIVSPALYAVKPIRACCELCGTERAIEEMAAGSGGYDWNNPDPDFQGSVGLLSYHCKDGVGCRQNRRDAAEFARLDAEAAEAARYDNNSPGKIGGM